MKSQLTAAVNREFFAFVIQRLEGCQETLDGIMCGMYDGLSECEREEVDAAETARRECMNELKRLATEGA